MAPGHTHVLPRGLTRGMARTSRTASVTPTNAASAPPRFIAGSATGPARRPLRCLCRWICPAVQSGPTLPSTRVFSHASMPRRVNRACHGRASSHTRCWRSSGHADPNRATPAGTRPHAATLAVNSIPSALIAAIVVFNVGSSCSLSGRQRYSRERPVCSAIYAIQFARATTPSACAI